MAIAFVAVLLIILAPFAREVAEAFHEFNKEWFP